MPLTPPRRSTPRLATLASALILVGALFTLGGSATNIASASAPARCTTSDLSIWLNTQGSGAAGSSYYELEFTNLSAHACTLTGYPGVSALSLSHRQLGAAAGRDPATPARDVTLLSASSPRVLNGSIARASAHATLQITVAENYPDATCTYVSASALRIYPPNQRVSTIVGFPFVTCAKAADQVLHVAPVAPGLGASS